MGADRPGRGRLMAFGSTTLASIACWNQRANWSNGLGLRPARSSLPRVYSERISIFMAWRGQ